MTAMPHTSSRKYRNGMTFGAARAVKGAIRKPQACPGGRSPRENPIPLRSQTEWHTTADDYVRRYVYPDGRRGKAITILMSRLIMNPSPGEFVDHVNGNTLDNRRCNLRLCTRQQNAQNRAKHDRLRVATSRYKGVYWVKDRRLWTSRITTRGKQVTLGYFPSELEAADAYDQAARRHFANFARLNFPSGLELWS
jgi:HNH endonuclease